MNCCKKEGDWVIYFDNAATTYPKPDSVYKALDYANRNLAFNSGRGEYKESVTGFDIIEETRFKIANLVSTKASNVIFSSSATESLNQIINGMNISSGDTIYISPFEHNAVVRPLYLIKIFDVLVIRINKNFIIIFMINKIIFFHNFFN